MAIHAWKFGNFRETIHCYRVCTHCGTMKGIFVSLSRYWWKEYVNQGN